jgi:hypothetical protein
MRIIECTYTNLGVTAFFPPRLHGINTVDEIASASRAMMNTTARDSSNTRENDTEMQKHEMCETAAGITQHTALWQTKDYTLE